MLLAAVFPIPDCRSRPLRAAKGIAAYLSQGKAHWPVTEEDMEEFARTRGAARPAPAARPSGAAACPRCARPLPPGEEAHLCCAGARISWRCRACSKVREGLAFPFGACPSCGGSLEVLDERAPPGSEAALAALRLAFEIELGGRSFYRQAAREAGDSHLRELFGKFAAMEDEHLALLSSRYHVEPPAPEGRAGVAGAAVYGGTPEEPQDPYNLFRIAIGFERRAAGEFAARAAASPEGSEERGIYSELATEEEEHAELLATELRRYREMKPGIL